MSRRRCGDPLIRNTQSCLIIEYIGVADLNLKGPTLVYTNLFLIATLHITMLVAERLAKCYEHILEALITSARRLCNHLGLYVCMCVCMCVCVCVFVCEHDNSKNNKHFDAKFCTYICHCLRKS